MGKKYSLIIPVLKMEDNPYLENILSSLSEQSLKPQEVHLVVGDKRQGRAINYGVKQSSTEYIGTVDDDTMIDDPELFAKLLDTMEVAAGDKMLVVINGSGATTMMEQLIVLRAVGKLLEARGLQLARSMVGEFLTVQEMGGFQMCVAKLDDELIELLDAPCNAPSLTCK